MKKNALYVLALLAIFPLSTQAQQAGVGKVVFVKGSAFVEHVSPPEKKPLKFNDAVFPMDTLVTSDGELKVMLTDESVLSLGKNSKLLITEYVYSPKQSKRKTVIDVIKGTIRTIFTKTSQALKTNDITIQTPTAVAGIRGTDVGVQVSGNNTNFSCFDGSFEAYFKGDPSKKVVLNGGDFTQINNAPPTQPAPIPPTVQQQFESQMAPPPVDDVATQPGGENLNGAYQEQKADMPPPPPGAPPPGSQTTTDGQNPPPPPPTTQQPGTGTFGPPPPPPPPPLIPGGGTQTPTDAGTQTPKGDAQVPLNFPDEVK